MKKTLANLPEYKRKELQMKINTAKLILLVVILFCQVTQAVEKTVYPPLKTVFQKQRSDIHDTIYFRNKDILRGEVINTDVIIATQYGMLKVPLRHCAGISFEGARANTEAIVIVNFNRITGIITDRVLKFRIKSSGTEIPIRKEKIRYVLLKRSPDETEFLKNHDKSDLFLMINGDLLSGEAEERKVSIQTDYGRIPVSFDEMKDVQMQGGDNVTAIITKTNGDTMRGTLDTDEISLHLELGINIEAIYKDKFAKIFIDQAHKQAPLQFGVQQPIAGESDGIVSTYSLDMTQETLTLNLEPLLGEKGTKMKFVLIPAGEFIMGSGSGEAGRQTDEGPVHKVKISKPFYMGVYEVTQKQYVAIMGDNPSQFAGSNNPVEQVIWNDAIKFCKKMSTITKNIITLPTEAQWEYACRAGISTAYCFGDESSLLSDYAWYKDNSRGKTHPVGQKKPNAFGLYDMHGNVWEWCQDWYDKNYYKKCSYLDPENTQNASYRILRGGSWFSVAYGCRSAIRDGAYPDGWIDIGGFRVVLSVSSQDF
jgi:formylglycine-generating enzyme required for sulfatase activity